MKIKYYPILCCFALFAIFSCEEIDDINPEIEFAKPSLDDLVMKNDSFQLSAIITDNVGLMQISYGLDTLKTNVLSFSSEAEHELEVKVLVNGDVESGEHNVLINAIDVNNNQSTRSVRILVQ